MKFLHLCSFFIFTELLLIFCQKKLNLKLSLKKKIIYSLINIIFLIIGMIVPNISFGYISISIFSTLFLFISLKIFLINIIINLCIESLILFYAHNMLLNLNSSQVIIYNIFGIFTLIFITIFNYLFLLINKKISKNSLLVTAIHKNSKLITSLFAVNLFFILINIIFQKNYILFLFALSYTSINIIIYQCLHTYNNIEIENLEFSKKTVLELYDNTRSFKHDFQNILQAIGGYIWVNDFEGLKCYYKQIFSDCKLCNNLDKLNPDIINNPAIYNIILNKYEIANKNNIEFNLDIMIDLNELDIKIYEFSRILGILLDNAIEASKECQEKCINLLFKKDKYKQVLIIENTYNNKQISIDQIFEKNYSTKPKNSGLGLWEVRKILKKYSNLNLYTSKNNDFFSQQLEIYSA